jgi:hypothetical protein
MPGPPPRGEPWTPTLNKIMKVGRQGWHFAQRLSYLVIRSDVSSRGVCEALPSPNCCRLVEVTRHNPPKNEQANPEWEFFHATLEQKTAGSSDTWTPQGPRKVTLFYLSHSHWILKSFFSLTRVIYQRSIKWRTKFCQVEKTKWWNKGWLDYSLSKVVGIHEIKKKDF